MLGLSLSYFDLTTVILPVRNNGVAKVQSAAPISLLRRKKVVRIWLT